MRPSQKLLTFCLLCRTQLPMSVQKPVYNPLIAELSSEDTHQHSMCVCVPMYIYIYYIYINTRSWGLKWFLPLTIPAMCPPLVTLWKSSAFHRDIALFHGCFVLRREQAVLTLPTFPAWRCWFQHSVGSSSKFSEQLTYPSMAFVQISEIL